ncbi:MAG: hypothetical protein ACLTW9_00730 [Enterocloster sp.]
MERLTEASWGGGFLYQEYSAQEARPAFDSMTEGMKRICGLENRSSNPCPWRTRT